jgi:RNA polymerase sigma factor (sigma-70 family)
VKPVAPQIEESPLPEIVDFLDEHGCVLFGLLYRVTLREDTAEDLMQDLFLKLDASENFPTAKCPLAYARRVALHLAFDWRRKHSQGSTTRIADQQAVDHRPSPLDGLIAAEQLQAVLNAMAGLSDRNCELLTLRYLEQQSYEAIAREHGKTPHQIRALCHKALAQLRALLSENRQEAKRGASL